jgi:hypothetical protein
MDSLTSWKYRLARGAGYSRWDSFCSAFFNIRLPSRKAEMDAGGRQSLQESKIGLAEKFRQLRTGTPMSAPIEGDHVGSFALTLSGSSC